MLKNYLKIAFRKMFRNKAYSFINILGLAIGFACASMVFIWVLDELSFDKFHKNAKNMYIATFSNGSTTTPSALSNYLKKQFPEIENSARCSFEYAGQFNYKNYKNTENGGAFIDKELLDIFSIKLIKGETKTFFDSPNSIIISEDIAKKVFKEMNPIGKLIKWNGSCDLVVKGVMKNYPKNSSFNFRYFIPYTLLKERGYNLNAWDYNNLQTLVLLNDNVNVENLNKKIANIVELHRPTDKRQLSLQSVVRLHLYSFPNGGGFIVYVYIFTIIAFFILLIACINFVNLSTAMFAENSLEVGIRKTIGATRTNIMIQSFIESGILSFFALVLAVVFIVVLLPVFNDIAGKNFAVNTFLNLKTMLGLGGLGITVGVLAGLYPSVLLSLFKPVDVLKGKLGAGNKDSSLRKILVIVQFSISVFLIINSIIIFNQISYMKNKSLGYDKENIIHFNIGSKFIESKEVLKNEFLKNSNILNITLTNCAPYYWQENAGLGSVKWEGQKGIQTTMVQTAVDYDYLKTFNLKLKEGRFFSKEYQTDEAEAYVVNDAAIKAMQMDNPIGKELIISGRKGKIIGVVKDYNYESLHSKVLPMAMTIRGERYSVACLKVKGENIAETLAYIEKKYHDIYPDYEFNYSFLDDSILAMYKTEEKISKMLKIFTVLGIFISCIGLFGLISFAVESRKKEIGIRKILGASILDVSLSLSREFIVLVVVANFISWPISYYVMNRWLESFAYKEGISAFPFAIALISAVFIAIATISSKTLNIATANPIESIKYE